MVVLRVLLVFLMMYDITSYRSLRFHINSKHTRFSSISSSSRSNNDNANSYWSAIEPIVYTEVGLKEKLSSYEDKYQDSINDNDNDSDMIKKIGVATTTTTTTSSATSSSSTKAESTTSKVNLPFFDVNTLGNNDYYYYYY